jgi:hypothetical protein
MGEGDAGKIRHPKEETTASYIQFNERLEYSSCGQELCLASVTIHSARRIYRAQGSYSLILKIQG